MPLVPSVCIASKLCLCISLCTSHTLSTSRKAFLGLTYSEKEVSDNFVKM